MFRIPYMCSVQHHSEPMHVPMCLWCILCFVCGMQDGQAYTSDYPIDNLRQEGSQCVCMLRSLVAFLWHIVFVRRPNSVWMCSRSVREMRNLWATEWKQSGSPRCNFHTVLHSEWAKKVFRSPKTDRITYHHDCMHAENWTAIETSRAK